jgi:hypothetical protein
MLLRFLRPHPSFLFVFSLTSSRLPAVSTRVSADNPSAGGNVVRFGKLVRDFRGSSRTVRPPRVMSSSV